MSALNSGMDIIFILSKRYLDDIIKTQIQSSGALCLTIPGPMSTDGGITSLVQSINGNQFRNFVPILDSTRLADNTDRSVDVILSFKAGYGEINSGSGFRSIADGERIELPLTLTIGLDVEGQPKLTFQLFADVELVGFPPASIDILGPLGITIDNVTLDLDQLNRRRAVSFVNEDGERVREEKLVLGFQPTDLILKTVDAGLCVGINVELERDDIEEFRDQLNIFCDLPEQSIPDIPHFVDVFNVDADALPLPGFRDDWYLAISEHVINALIELETGIFEPGRPTSDCDRDEELLLPCMSIRAIRGYLIILEGTGRIYLCEYWGPVGGEGWVTFLASADLVIRKVPGSPRMVAEYHVTDVEILSPGIVATAADIGDIDPMDYLPESVRAGEIEFDFPASFGDRSSPLGLLSLSRSTTRSDGLIIQGHGSISSPRPPFIAAPGELLIANPCEGEAPPYLRDFSITGSTNLHICPPVFRGRDAELFSVTIPDSLAAGGGGTRGSRNINIQVALNGESGGSYEAIMDIPNSTERKSIELSANLREPVMDVSISRLNLFHTENVSPCGAVAPVRGIHRSVEVRNSGEGNLQICRVEFVGNPINASGQPIFQLTYNPVVIPPGGTGRLRIAARPRTRDAGRTFNSTMRIINNAGDPVTIALSARLTHRSFVDEPGIAGGINPDLVDILCLGLDWGFLRDHHRDRIVDTPLFEHLASFLDGFNCCPPPAVPACQCFDLLEARLENVAESQGLALQRTDTQIPQQVVRSQGPIMFAPFNPEAAYAILSETGGNTDYHNPILHLRRWVFKQFGEYDSDHPIDDMAIIEDLALLATGGNIDLVNLGNIEAPEFKTRLENFTEVKKMVSIGNRFIGIANGEGIAIYEMKKHGELDLISSFPQETLGGELLVPGAKNNNLYAYSIGHQEINIFDLSDIGQPKLVSTGSAELASGKGVLLNNQLIVYDQNTIASYSTHNPYKLTSSGKLQLGFEIQHIIAFGHSGAAIGPKLEIAYFSFKAGNEMILFAEMYTEDWLKPFVPNAGKLVPYRNHTVMLKNDAMGFRVMRIFSNYLNEAAVKKEMEKIQEDLPDH